jgi:hypothetical protein
LRRGAELAVVGSERGEGGAQLVVVEISKLRGVMLAMEQALPLLVVAELEVALWW